MYDETALPAYSVLSIGGFDPTGGAGVVADTKTVHALGGYGLAAITANTIQNTQKVIQISGVDAQLFEAQLNTIVTDMRVDAIKIGMIPNSQLVRITASVVKSMDCPIVLDTPFVASSGLPLHEESVLEDFMELLVPEVDLVTPNRHEASLLLQEEITDATAIDACRRFTSKFGVAILLTGGDTLQDTIKEVFCSTNSDIEHIFTHKRLHTLNTHGTGCALSAALATLLADSSLQTQEFPINVITQALEFVQASIYNSRNWSLALSPSDNSKTGINHFSQ